MRLNKQLRVYHNDSNFETKFRIPSFHELSIISLLRYSHVLLSFLILFYLILYKS